MNVLMKKISALTIRQQMIVVAICFVLLSYFFFVGLIAPQRDRITELETQRDSNLARLTLVDNFSLQHPQAETYLAELDQSIVQTNGLLPSESAVSTFVIQIQQVARDSQVELFHIAPGAYLNKAGYYEVPIEIGIRGSFFKVVDFIRRCEALPRFTSIATVNIQAKAGLLECKIPLVIYTFGIAPVKEGTAANQPKPAAPPVTPPAAGAAVPAPTAPSVPAAK